MSEAAISIDALTSTGRLLVQVGDRMVGVFLNGESVVAYEDLCPHRGGPLTEGDVVGNEIRCPWHGSKFALPTGKLLCGPATKPLKKISVRIEKGTAYLST